MRAAWSAAEAAAATDEGWKLAQRDDDREVLLRIVASGPAMPSDELAIAHVYERAQSGSAVHLRAMRFTLFPEDAEPTLREALTEIAQLQTDEEMEEATGNCMENDDAFATLHTVIDMARDALADVQDGLPHRPGGQTVAGSPEVAELARAASRLAAVARRPKGWNKVEIERSLAAALTAVDDAVAAVAA